MRLQVIKSTGQKFSVVTIDNMILPCRSLSGLSLTVRKALSGGVFAFGLLLPSLAYALGVGGVETRSYIGQPLRVEIPLYNVESPNTLKIDLERLDDDNDGELTATLSRANSQLSVLIRSSEPVNEPYFNFSLNLIDNGNEFRKQFTVLLNLSPTGDPRYIEQSTQRNATLSSDARVDKADENLSKVVSGSVMGPYDWAKAGQIPEKFGAVLDGQSLWRVARRISPAMNASNNQMMWALYQSNPQAFSSKSIESLRAGTFLTIPSSVAVTSISDQEAKRLLDNLSLAKRENTRVVSADESTKSDITDLTGIPSGEPRRSDRRSEGAVSGQFQLSGLDSAVGSEGVLVSASDDQSKEIISSLSETISSMTEQLGRKDKQIQVLEAQVVELKAFIQADGSPVPDMLARSKAVQSSSSLTVSSVDPSLNNNGQEATKPIEVIASNGAVNDEMGLTDPQPKAEGSSRWYLWLLAALGGLTLLGFAMRDRLTRLWYSLNFGGKNDKLEFQPTVFNEALSQAVAEKNDSQHTMTISHHASLSEDEYSESFSESFSEIDTEIFVDESTPEQELDFEQRFARLLAEGDLEFARQLLDIAHGHDVNDERYHYHRLQLLAINVDEDAFYDYYYSIENDIPSFTNSVQTDISKLVVQLAKH